MNLTSKDKFKIQLINNKKTPFIKIPKIKNLFNDTKFKNKIREDAWNQRFIYNKIPKYDSYKDKNVLCNKNANFLNYKTKDNYLNSKSQKNYINQTNIDINTKNDINNSLFLAINNRIQTLSPKNKNFSFSPKNSLSPNLHISFFDYNNKKLNNLRILWDELGILKPYRNYFNYIYKELETEYKEELYEKEIQELNQVKIGIKSLKNHIALRMSIIEDMKKLNDNLGKELLNKNNKGKELLLSEISDKIVLLREQTINVCQSMKKLKGIIFNIDNLGKYDFDLISKRFKFDKNYVIKMKSELKFLREGFSKYYFNIENDQTPFLLKASDKNKITKGDYLIRVIPIDKEIKNTIIDCLFYVHQELIAYQNININKNNFRKISPIKMKDNEFKDTKKTHFEVDCFINRECMTDRRNKNINGIEENISKQRHIMNYFEKDKKIKDMNFNKNINISKDNGNILLKKKNLNEENNNENIKPIIEDSYDILKNKKENYDKDQIINEKNDLIINIKQSTNKKIEKDDNILNNNIFQS